ncbi:MAG: hypothetical protein CM1200mP18_23210 [Gammaproteobacteria bacterium]|nr:MAG: hypothetical protein CM1200mP18_23210 [Gammaproteobacteria bacterium]
MVYVRLSPVVQAHPAIVVMLYGHKILAPQPRRPHESGSSSWFVTTTKCQGCIWPLGPYRLSDAFSITIGGIFRAE